MLPSDPYILARYRPMIYVYTIYDQEMLLKR